MFVELDCSSWLSYPSLHWQRSCCFGALVIEDSDMNNAECEVEHVLQMDVPVCYESKNRKIVTIMLYMTNNKLNLEMIQLSSLLQIVLVEHHNNLAQHIFVNLISL